MEKYEKLRVAQRKTQRNASYNSKMQKLYKNAPICVPLWNLSVTLCKFLNTDNQSDNKYFVTLRIFIKLNVLKFAEKNYFCGGKNQKLNI